MPEFEELYIRHFKCVYLFVLSLCQSQDIAEEVTQDTFFKALENIDGFKGNCNLNTWLCQIAKNTYFSYYTKQKRFADKAVENTSQQSFEMNLFLKDDAIGIHHALHGLDEPYKEVFTLRIFAELPYSQIALLFGKTESWARVTFHRAKRRIQDSLKED